jgi:hypothetical protein
MAGCGKTVSCSAVIKETLNRTSESLAATYFFCDYKTPASQVPVNILSSLALQLAWQKKEAFEILTNYYEELHPSTGLQTVPAKLPDTAGLTDTFIKMASLYEKVYVVVDALDECGDFVELTARALNGLADGSAFINIALFSRDLSEIAMELDKSSRAYMRVEVSKANVGSDINNYILHEMSQRTALLDCEPRIREEIRQKLREKSAGM